MRVAPSATSDASWAYAFGEYKIDVVSRTLWRGDEVVHLPSRAFDALLYLVERRDRIVQKDELVTAIWHDVIVTDDSLVHAISVLRRTLSDEPNRPRYIQTIPRRGYRFVGVARPIEPEPEPQPAAASPLQLAEPSAAAPGPVVPAVRERTRARLPLRRYAALASITAVAVALALMLFTPIRDVGTATQPRGLRLFQPPPAGTTIVSGGVLSPDGRFLAFVARDEATGRSALWLRALYSSELRALEGTEGASKPFWSPDGRQLGFFAGGYLSTVDVTGGSPRSVTAVGLAPAGGTWAPDDTILFAEWTRGLYSVHASGDEVTTVAELDRAARDIAFAWPQFLSDGRHFLYQIVSLDPARTGAYVGDLDTSRSFRLLETESPAVFAPPRHVLHVQRDMLIAEEFDARSLELGGRAMVLARGVSPPSLADDNVVSAAGNLLAFRHLVKEQSLAWVGRAGEVLRTLSMPTVLFNPRVSPDGSWLLATSSVTSNPGVWLASLTREEFERLDVDGIAPLWAPDGTRIAFTARGGYDLLVRPLAGGDPVRPLISDGAIKILNDWSPDGTEILYSTIDAETELDLWRVRLEDAAAVPVLATPVNEMQARISPDGRWMAYVSDETGDIEVYVERYPELGDKRRVSSAGGGQPQWRADQRELYYLSPDRTLMAVPVENSAQLVFGAPRGLFRAPVAGDPDDARDHYAASADGARFLLDSTVEKGDDSTITIVVDWGGEAGDRARGGTAELISRLLD